MAWSWTRLWERLTGQADDDLARELRAHLDQDADERQAADDDLSPAAARDAARRAFGSVLRATEDTRAVWLGNLISVEQRLRDIRIGLRALWRTKWLSGAAILTLAIGIGANAALFSVIDAVLLRTLPFRDPRQLVMIVQTTANDDRNRQFAPTTYFDWKRQNHTFADLAVIRTARGNLVAHG